MLRQVFQPIKYLVLNSGYGDRFFDDEDPYKVQLIELCRDYRVTPMYVGSCHNFPIDGILIFDDDIKFTEAKSFDEKLQQTNIIQRGGYTVFDCSETTDIFPFLFDLQEIQFCGWGPLYNIKFLSDNDQPETMIATFDCESG